MTDFFTPEKDKPGFCGPPTMRDDLPNVLLIGDSISCGYTEAVVERLRDVCHVRRAPDNCGDTRRGLKDLDRWLGDTAWDLIHFNFGLHDLCYRHPEASVYGNRDKINGTISVPIDVYAENLEMLVQRLLATGSNLVWASTTFVPEGEAGRYQGDDVRYNAAAAAVMKRHGIPINDLHALTAAFGAEMFTGPGDVHYTGAGSRKIAGQVAACIRAQHLPS